MNELIEGSETSAFRTQTPGNYPKENILHKERGESLKSRNLILFIRHSVSELWDNWQQLVITFLTSYSYIKTFFLFAVRHGASHKNYQTDHRHMADITVTAKRVATPAVSIDPHIAGVGVVAEQLRRWVQWTDNVTGCRSRSLKTTGTDKQT